MKARTRILMLSSLVVALGAAAPVRNPATQDEDCSGFCKETLEACMTQTDACVHAGWACLPNGCSMDESGTCVAGLCCNTCTHF